MRLEGKVALTDIDEAEFNRVMYTNVLGSYYTVQACLPLMGEGSTIILNTSVTASLGLPNFSLYIAAKSAMKFFIHTWTAELRDRRIRVNAIAPGIIPTPAAGGELEAACVAARGSADKPLAASEVIDKFRLICGLADSDRIVDAVMMGDCDLGTLLHVR